MNFREESFKKITAISAANLFVPLAMTASKLKYF